MRLLRVMHFTLTVSFRKITRQCLTSFNQGFTNPLAVEINPRTIHRNHELYKMYTDMFPFLSAGDDENKLLAKTAVIQVIYD